LKRRAETEQTAIMPAILTIQSQVVHAQVGNTIAGFALRRMGVRVMELPTTILGRRPDRGAPGGGAMPVDFLLSLLDALEADGALESVGAILSGYLALPTQADIVLEAVARIKRRNPAAVYVCDPVMGDAGGAFVKEAVAAAIIDRLVPIADIITPNLFELGLITGAPHATLAEAFAAATRLAPRVLLTSAPTDQGSGVLWVAPPESWLVEHPCVPDAPKGVGDLFAALFVARRVLGQSIVASLEGAAGAVQDVIRQSRLDQSPHLPVIAAQEKLAHPITRPNARAFEG
jgi:pyridoxine kinase